jgi:hypothetical protein
MPADKATHSPQIRMPGPVTIARCGSVQPQNEQARVP